MNEYKFSELIKNKDTIFIQVFLCTVNNRNEFVYLPNQNVS